MGVGVRDLLSREWSTQGALCFFARSERSAAKPALWATKRRVAGIGGVIPRPEESLPRTPVLAVPLPWAPGRLCPRPNAYVTADTSRQSNTHSTESREIRYPWHPWYGRPVWIHGVLVKSGQAVYRCSLEQNLEARLFEIPQWMFESGACCGMHRAENPAVEYAALQDLKLLLHRARSPARDLVVQGQHQSAPGGADARITESIEGSANRIVSPTPAESSLAKATARNQTTDRGTTGATAAPTQPENHDRASRKGERRRVTKSSPIIGSAKPLCTFASLLCN